MNKKQGEWNKRGTDVTINVRIHSVVLYPF